jgi:hypothetical protein
MVGYEGHSETERMSVGYDSLANLNLLKIQSGPMGNLRSKPFDGDRHM